MTNSQSELMTDGRAKKKQVMETHHLSRVADRLTL